MTSLKILVVDDDKDGADGLAEALELYGHQVTTAYSGFDAVKLFRHTVFDLTFMDVMMLGLNGVESLMQIRKIAPKARVFMMTGYSARDLLDQAVDEGAAGVLQKPFAIEEVLENVKGSLLC